MSQQRLFRMNTALTVLKSIAYTKASLNGEVDLLRSWAQDNERDLPADELAGAIIRRELKRAEENAPSVRQP